MLSLKLQHSVNKTGWGEGPWQHEADSILWVDELTELPCLMHRSQIGAWCGYVGITRNHPWHRVDHKSLPRSLQVHGGLSYSDAEPIGPIAWVQALIASEFWWWFGFDCCHAGDYAPKLQRYHCSHECTHRYRTVSYVAAQCHSLAQQIAAAKMFHVKPSQTNLGDC